MFIHAGGKSLKLSTSHDSSGVLYYTFYLKPPAWVASTEYVEGDIVGPTTPTGFYYIVTSSGVSGATEPVWGTVKGGATTDNTVSYKANNNNAYMTANSILLSATISASDSVPIVDQAFTTDGVVMAQIGPIPTGVSSFMLTCTFTADTGYLAPEVDEYSVIVKVKEQ